MSTISSLLQKFQSLDTDEIINESFVATTSQFEDTQRLQLMAGKTKTGDPISPSYMSPKYAAAKNEMNSLPGLGVPDLNLTGAFHEEIDMEVGNDSLDIISKDSKGPELEDKYKDIFGLGTNFKTDYLEILSPVINEKISNFTGLPFG